MINKETINSGAPSICIDCGIKLELEILQSNAGYYIGTECNCGPYSRESGYYRTRKDIEKAIKEEKVSWRN